MTKYFMDMILCDVTWEPTDVNSQRLWCWWAFAFFALVRSRAASRRMWSRTFFWWATFRFRRIIFFCTSTGSFFGFWSFFWCFRSQLWAAAFATDLECGARLSRRSRSLLDDDEEEELDDDELDELERESELFDDELESDELCKNIDYQKVRLC